MQAAAFTRKNLLFIRIGLMFSFTFLMVLSSQVRIPLFFTPVPLTLQTLVVLLGIIFLKRQAYIAQIGYVSLGIAGFGVFANGGCGPLYLLGPTGGYIAGFLLSSLIIGNVYERIGNASYGKNITLFAAAIGIIYICGISWLVSAWAVPVSVAFSTGVIPFLVPDIIKVVLAAVVAERFSRV